jgi:integrase
MSLSLREFFDSHYVPTYLTGTKPRTITAYIEAINHWTSIHGNTPIAAITTKQLAAFKDALFKGTARRCLQRPLFPEIDLSTPARALARATVNKHLRAIMAMLNKAGPPGYRNRDALGLITSVPWVRPMKTPKPNPRCISIEDLAAFYLAAEFAEFPKQNPKAWWQTLMIVAYTTAFRHAALMAIEWANINLGQALIRLPADADKCVTERIKPLHHLAVLHLRKLRKSTVNYRVFEWSHGNKTFYRQWHDLQDAAGIKRHFTLHDIKRTTGSRLAEISSPWVVQQMLDHSSITTSQSYINATDQLRAAVEKLPIPDSMKGFTHD